MSWTIVICGIVAFILFCFAIRAFQIRQPITISICVSWMCAFTLVGIAVHERYEVFDVSIGRDGASLRLEKQKPIESGQFEKAPGSVFVSQEYPNSQGYTYRQSIPLRSNPAVMTWQDSEQPFWLGIGNLGGTNFSNPKLFLNFKGNVEVKVDSRKSRGWVEMDPNISYVYSAQGDLQPGVLARLNPLYIKFPDEGVYQVECTVTGDDALPVWLGFEIRVEGRT